MVLTRMPLIFFWGLTVMRWGDEDTTREDENVDWPETLITILALIALIFLLATIVAVSR